MKPRIAFYAPLKSPHHPTPSGDREMARNLLGALELCGYDAFVASEVISYQKRPSRDLFLARRSQCEAVASDLVAQWRADSASVPDLWFTYHPYCKSPDWIGPTVSRAFGIPYVTVEACRTRQNADEDWAEARMAVQTAVRGAALNFCLKPSDREYLATFLPDMNSVVSLPPFIDDRALAQLEAHERRTGNSPTILAVGMMRPGAKIDSYRRLSEALTGMTDTDWRLVIVGEGPERPCVESMFGFAGERMRFTGALPHAQVIQEMHSADILAWPGIREAFGVVYLEAQACGLPIVAFRTAGVPVVVRDQVTGLLAADGDVEEYRAHLRRLLASPQVRRIMGDAGREEVAQNHSLTAAATTLKAGIEPLLASAPALP